MAVTRQRRGITINDVAKAAGVSKATASVALSGERGAASGVRVAPETRVRIQQAAERLGYRRNALALALLEGRTYTVGLVSQVAPPPAKGTAAINSYQKDVMIAVACACAQAGLRLTTILVGSPGATTADEIADGRVDGAILATLRDEELSREVFRRGFPAVTIGSGYSERRVAPDNRGAIRAAVEYLAGLGHRRIAFVTFPLPSGDSWTMRERRAGYDEAMAARGAEPWVFANDALDAGLAGREGHAERPTAYVCFNDVVAVDVLRWARRRGWSVPDDLSVVGFDDGVLAAHADPRLTTVENPLDAQAEAAVALLQSLWRGEPVPAPAPIPTRLIVRESTAAPPRPPA